MTHVGIDIGTFHTVAVSVNGREITIPNGSVPSIALRAKNAPIVGHDAIGQLGLNFPLIQAPKLLLGSDEVDRKVLCEIISKLAWQAAEDLGLGTHTSTVVTVPPGWNLNQCELMSEALRSSFPKIIFFHEPVALLVAAWWLSPMHVNPAYFAKLTRFSEIIVCDWGAGTVDLSAIEVMGEPHEPEFRCIGEITNADWGGTRIARLAVSAYRNAGHKLTSDDERASLFLQQSWADNRPSPIPLEGFAPFVLKRRQNAAFAIQSNVSELLRQCSSASKVLFVMHGGPLESTELREEFGDALETIGITRERQLYVGSDFVDGLHAKPKNLRRETLVALGASVFAERGRALPEYQYRLNLRDAAGQVSSSVKLAVTHTTRGIQAVTPPYTGVDYAVEVQQIRGDVETPQRKELAIHVREDALVLYRIAEAGVGFAEVAATEARNLPVPKPFNDAVVATVRMPERSTRFQIRFEGTR